MIIILKRGEVQGSEVHDDVINDYFIYAHIRVKLYHDTLTMWDLGIIIGILHVYM